MSDQTMLGHNGGPDLDEPAYKMTLRTRWAKALFADASTPSNVIAMCWPIHWYSRADGSGAALSNEQFAHFCGLSEASVKRGKRWLLANEYVRITVGNGREKTQFQMTIPSSSREVIETPQGDHTEQGSILSGVTQTPLGVHTDPQGVHTDPPGGSQRPNIYKRDSVRTLEDIQDTADAGTTEVETPKSEPEKPGFWGRVFSAPKDEHVNVIFENGKLTLLNGARAEWLGHFQGDEGDLDLALIEIAAEIQPNSIHALESQVSRKLAQMTRRRREQDKRYTAAASRNKRPSAGQPEESQRERAKRFAEEAAAQIDAEKARRR